MAVIQKTVHLQKMFTFLEKIKKITCVCGLTKGSCNKFVKSFKIKHRERIIMWVVSGAAATTFRKGKLT